MVQTGRETSGVSNYTGSMGADTFIMMNPGDVMSGGSAGSDTLDINYAAILGGLSVDLSSTTDQIVSWNGSVASGTVTGFDNVDASGYTGSFGALLTGSSAANTITGTQNADQITGGGGDDTIVTGAGADTVDGGSGADNINLGNVLVAGDTAGDAGDLAGSLASDAITFVVADDTIQLSETIFGTMGNGATGVGAALNAAQFANAAGTAASLAGLGLDNTGNGAIIMDTTNNDVYFVEAGVDLTAGATDTIAEIVAAGNAIKIADLTLTGTVTAADFEIVA